MRHVLIAAARRLLGQSTEVVDGSIADRRFVATMTRDGALVAALAFDDARGLAPYRAGLANGGAT